MMSKPFSGKRHPSSSAAAAATNTRFLQDIEALGKALSFDPKPSRRALPPPPPPPDPKPKSKPSSHKDKKSSSSSSSSSSPSSSSFWNWKPLKKLSHIGQRRFACYFTLTVHSIDGLPPTLSDGAAIAVHWKRTTDPASAATATRPVRTFGGVAEFDETLSYRCTVYGARSGGPHNSAKYDPRHFLIWVALADAAPGAADLGRNLVDLTRLLPLSLEELEDEEKSMGRWSTSFRLSGKARGATLSVSFGFSLVGEELSGSGRGDERKASEVAGLKAGRADRLASRGRTGGMVRSRDRSRSVEDIKVLHEVLTSSNSDALVLTEAETKLDYKELENDKLGSLDGGSKMESEVMLPPDDDSSDMKPCTTREPVREHGEGCEEHGFMVVEQGVEIGTKHQLGKSWSEEVKLEVLDGGGGMIGQNEEVGVRTDELVEDLTCLDDFYLKESNPSPGGPNMEDLDSALMCLSLRESETFKSPQATTKAGNGMSHSDFETKPGDMMNGSPGLDDFTNSVASEFLNMLGMEHSPFGLSSDSDPESPRERLWKQFEKESLAAGDGIFGLPMGIEGGSSATGDAVFGIDMGMDGCSATNDGIFGVDIEAEEHCWGDISDVDLTKIVLEAETELQRATQGIDSKSRAKMLEDAETEALMLEWGLDEKAFHRSPPESTGGFGSPIDLPPEEPRKLPPLGEGLGPFLQTKDGGFVRSMNPSLFKSAKNNGRLIMQASSPVVVPAEMGSGIMDILQGLASVGIEKLSMQAKKLMPLEEISGKTMQQVAWEASPALEACERQKFLQDPNPEVESGIGESGPVKKKTISLNRSSSSNEMGSEYVSIEDLAPLAMDKIETLSIEGLRIQSGMSDNEAPSNISPQSISDISAMEGKMSTNCGSLGLEGAAGLQLMDVKDSGDDIDGLMSLSITLDEWMRLDSGIVDEEEISERTSKILAAHHACSADFSTVGSKGDKRGGKRSGRRWGLLGNHFTVALLVQLRDPLRDFEPVGTPMLALIQVERVFVPPKPKIYDIVSDKGNSEEDDEPQTSIGAVIKEEKKEEEDVPQFRITEVHVSGLKTEPGPKKLWGNPRQQQSGSRWLLATGMGKSNKHPFMKSKAGAESFQATTTGDSLWSISSRVHGMGGRQKEFNLHKRNPNVTLPNQSARLR